MQGSPLGKLEVAFVANSPTQKVVANMEVDREYNACKALDPQIDNEDDVQHSSRHYEINEQELQTQMGLGGLHGCNEWAGRTGRSGLVAALYGRGGLADERVRKPGRGGLGRTGADWGGLGDWRTGGRGGLQNPGRGGLGQTGRVGADGADWGTGGQADAAAWTGRTAADGADWDGRGRVGRMGADGPVRQTGRTGADEADGAEGGVLGRAWRGIRGGLGITPGEPFHSLACRGDSRSAKSGCGLWGHLAPYTADPHQILRCSCRRLFLGTHTSKAQRPSTSDKFFGSLGALNITYSMFIQMGHAIRDVVIVSYKGGSSSLVPPLPLCTSCCS